MLAVCSPGEQMFSPGGLAKTCPLMTSGRKSKVRVTMELEWQHSFHALPRRKIRMKKTKLSRLEEFEQDLKGRRNAAVVPWIQFFFFWHHLVFCVEWHPRSCPSHHISWIVMRHYNPETSKRLQAVDLRSVFHDGCLCFPWSEVTCPYFPVIGRSRERAISFKIPCVECRTHGSDSILHTDS